MVDENKTGSVFWIIFILMAFVGLAYLSIWGFHNDSLKAIALGTIYMAILIFSIVATKLEVFTLEIDFLKSCSSFTVGFLLWFFIGATIKILGGEQTNFLYSAFSAVKLPTSNLLAAVSGELPIFWEYYINDVTVPVIEELFWLLAIPILLIMAMEALSDYDKLGWMGNKIFQFIIVVLVSSSTFAIFHVGSIQLLAFVIGAMIFRTTMLLMYWGDKYWDIIPFAVLLASFAVGAHTGNNISDSGLMNFILVMKQNFYGWFVMAILGLVGVLGITNLIDKFFGLFGIGTN
ncbi:hypothetical protein KKG81_04465 [bacterium]|nr:hypothetical protein [bacterium]